MIGEFYMTTKYGISESEKKAEKSLECRRIVQEIVNYGISQDQMLQIVKLLALEMENRDNLLKLVDVVDDLRSQESKLISQ